MACPTLRLASLHHTDKHVANSSITSGNKVAARPAGAKFTISSPPTDTGKRARGNHKQAACMIVSREPERDKGTNGTTPGRRCRSTRRAPSP
eukprot:4676555-Alexandrium_andersonii.AAC.1